jgi:hypothetical protein
MQLCLTPVGLRGAFSMAIPQSPSPLSRSRRHRVFTAVGVPRVALESNSSEGKLEWRPNQSKLAAILLPVAAACAVFTACPASGTDSY